MIITIDGLAGTGKTTVARKVAEQLGWRYFDTGAMYRAVTYGLLQKKIAFDDTEAVKHFLEQFSFVIRLEDNKPLYFIADEDVTLKIRAPEVNDHVSQVAASKEVRKALVEIQREYGRGDKVVFEGRDMGTTVFPEAKLKIFLTARSSVRAERRYLELKEKKLLSSESQILENLLMRDEKDSSREISPLRQAEDAHLIDTSDLSVEEIVRLIVSLVPPQR